VTTDATGRQLNFGELVHAVCIDKLNANDAETIEVMDWILAAPLGEGFSRLKTIDSINQLVEASPSTADTLPDSPIELGVRKDSINQWRCRAAVLHHIRQCPKGC